MSLLTIYLIGCGVVLTLSILTLVIFNEYLTVGDLLLTALAVILGWLFILGVAIYVLILAFKDWKYNHWDKVIWRWK